MVLKGCPNTIGLQINKLIASIVAAFNSDLTTVLGGLNFTTERREPVEKAWHQFATNAVLDFGTSTPSCLDDFSAHIAQMDGFWPWLRLQFRLSLIVPFACELRLNSLSQ